MGDRIKEAEALATMKESEGWKVVESWIKDAQDLAKNSIFNTKQNKNWNDFIHFRSTHNAYSKLLAIIDIKIERGIRQKNDS